MNSRPSTSHGPSSTLPIIKSFRFSSSHDVTSLPQTNGTSTSAKRTSRLQEFMGRSRTASLPPRPQTSNGLAQGQGRHKHLTVVGKGKASEREESQDSAASSSLASGEYSLCLNRYMRASGVRRTRWVYGGCMRFWRRQCCTPTPLFHRVRHYRIAGVICP